MLETGIDLPCGGYRTLVICIFAGDCNDDPTVVRLIDSLFFTLDHDHS